MKVRLPPESSAHSCPQRRLWVKEMSPDRESDNGRDVTPQPATRDMEPISPGQKRPWCVCVCNHHNHPFVRVCVYCRTSVSDLIFYHQLASKSQFTVWGLLCESPPKPLPLPPPENLISDDFEWTCKYSVSPWERVIGIISYKSVH